MKFHFLLVFSLLCVFSAQAQESSEAPVSAERLKNELRVNLAYTLFEIAEINYERLIGDEIGVGLAASYWFGDDYAITYMFNPYFRFYPVPSARAATFFIEGNAGIVGGVEHSYFHNEHGTWLPRNTDVVRGGAGVAAGAKFVSKGNFVAEAYLGLGRVFGDYNFTEVYPRLGLTFGKRF